MLEVRRRGWPADAESAARLGRSAQLTGANPDREFPLRKWADVENGQPYLDDLRSRDLNFGIDRAPDTARISRRSRVGPAAARVHGNCHRRARKLRRQHARNIERDIAVNDAVEVEARTATRQSANGCLLAVLRFSSAREPLHKPQISQSRSALAPIPYASMKWSLQQL